MFLSSSQRHAFAFETRESTTDGTGSSILRLLDEIDGVLASHFVKSLYRENDQRSKRDKACSRQVCRFSVAPASVVGILFDYLCLMSTSCLKRDWSRAAVRKR